MSSNRLRDTLSPYLLQHADNPVDWYPWGPEALDRARSGDRPILLSVGYSACHWCHVMAHESFEDADTAALMNRYFVNIKVDREERPDLDRIYQLAHQILTGRGGGWPLTVFLDPADLAPFFAGTYFPNPSRQGMIAFPDLLERIHQAWGSRREEIRAQNRQLLDALGMLGDPRSSGTGTGDPTDTVIGQLAARFDQRHGGFGGAPKFPQAPLLALLMDLDDDEQARQMLSDTLQAMTRTGLFDHLGGGFFRYCVDAAWEIPHFEKMLCDNALLLPLYAEAAVRWNMPDMAVTARRTVAWLEREMALEGGGFAASLDADTGDGEGAFYVWTPDQVADVLEPESTELFQARFGLDGPANFEGKHWHLVVARSVGELVRSGQDAGNVEATLEEARLRLLGARDERERPGRDDKLIAGWNGLTIAGLARAGRLLGEPAWIESADHSLAAVQERLFRHDPPHAVWRAGRSDHPALLDDLAAVLLAALELLGSRFDGQRLEWAGQLAERILDQFADPETGALYLTPRQHEYLPTRPLAHADDATPGGAGLAILGLQRLGHLIGDARMLSAAERALDIARGDLQRAPVAHATILRALRHAARPRPQVLVGGPGPDADTWSESLHRDPDLDTYRIPPGIPELPDLLAPIAEAESPVAMVCLGTKCLAPAHDPDTLRAQLAEIRPS